MTKDQEFVAKLSDGYSIQSKSTNNFWLVLLISSIIAIVGRIDEKNLIDLPFTLGKVLPADFYSITIILISVVIIAFSSAMMQTMRTRILIQKAIDGLPESEKFIGNVHVQDFFDSIVSPTYIRVAPISQFMLGNNQFFGMGKQSPTLKRLAFAFYIILRLTTFIFLYFIPSFALRKCWLSKHIGKENATLHIPDILLFSLIAIAGICMLTLFVGDIKHMIKVSKRVLK